MRPAWRLGINSLSGRRSRSALLIAAVALSAALITAVACALASMQKGLKNRIETSVGAADIQIRRIGSENVGQDILQEVEKWPEVKLVAGRGQAAIALRNPKNGQESSTLGNGIMPGREQLIRPTVYTQGREPQTLGEVALDESAAKDLGAKLGETLEVERFGTPITLNVVGIVKPASIGIGVITRPESTVTIQTLDQVTNPSDATPPPPPSYRELDVVLKDGVDADKFAKAKDESLGKGVLVRPSSKVTAGLARSQKTSQIAMTIASALAMFSASFIIMTGLTTSVTERLRELAMLRCIGGTRFQLAESQLVVGGVVGLAGAVIGVPIGLLGAYLLVSIFPEHFPGGFAFNWYTIVLGLAGSIGAGLIGALYPAIRAASTSPLEALAARARPVTPRNILIAGLLGLVLIGVHLGIFLFVHDPDTLFALDMGVALPALFTGYFLLAVPGVWVMTTLLGPWLSNVMGVPSGILIRSVKATPFRFGFTSGAMMMGLAMLVAIWTNGSAIERDWLGTFRFPDAFAAGISISQAAQQRIAKLPFIKDTTPITVQNFRTRAFGLKALDNAQTTFIGFDPRDFLNMAKLTWVQGDPKSALPELEKGGAVLVAKEFQTTRGVQVGDTLTLYQDNTPYTFKVVGVVTSPGLDIVSKYFQIGEDYLNVAVNAVFGNRADLERLFNNTSVRLLQINFKNNPETRAMSDAELVRKIHQAGGSEVLEANSGRAIINEIKTYISDSLYVFSLVAVAGMLVACLGVANLIVAGIQARQYEFGVLRAIGAQRGLIARLVLGEAAIIALTACWLGTIMGTQAAWAGQKLNQALLGLSLTLHVPPVPTLSGWLLLTVITLGAAAPAVLAVNRRKPRELLGAVRG